MMSVRIVVGAVASFAAAACATDTATGTLPYAVAASVQAIDEGNEASDAAHRDLNAVRRELLDVDREWARVGADTNLVESLAAPMAADGIFLAPGTGWLRGPDAVRQFLSANPNNLASKWRWSAIRVDVSSDGKHGYTFGYTEFQLPNGAILPGKYHAYWIRQPDSSWKMAGYKRTARPAGAVSLTPPPGFTTPVNVHRRYLPNSEPVAELETVFGIDLAFSADAADGIADAFARFAAPQAAQTGATASWAFGPDEIHASALTLPEGLSWAPELGAAAQSGDLAFTVGLVYSNGSAVSKYFTVWQKQDTGRWLYIVD